MVQDLTEFKPCTFIYQGHNFKGHLSLLWVFPEKCKDTKSTQYKQKEWLSSHSSFIYKDLINRNISEEDLQMPCRVLLRLLPFRELYRG